MTRFWMYSTRSIDRPIPLFRLSRKDARIHARRSRVGGEPPSVIARGLLLHTCVRSSGTASAAPEGHGCAILSMLRPLRGHRGGASLRCFRRTGIGVAQGEPSCLSCTSCSSCLPCFRLIPFFGIIYQDFLKNGSCSHFSRLDTRGGSAAEKKSLFDTLVGTLVETSEGGSAPPCGSIFLTHREAEFHNLPPCGSKIRDKPAVLARLRGFAGKKTPRTRTGCAAAVRRQKRAPVQASL